MCVHVSRPQLDILHETALVQKSINDFLWHNCFAKM